MDSKILFFVFLVLFIIVFLFIIFKSTTANKKETFEDSSDSYQARLNVIDVFDSYLKRNPTPKEINKYSSYKNEQDILSAVTNDYNKDNVEKYNNNNTPTTENTESEENNENDDSDDDVEDDENEEDEDEDEDEKEGNVNIKIKNNNEYNKTSESGSKTKQKQTSNTNNMNNTIQSLNNSVDDEDVSISLPMSDLKNLQSSLQEAMRLNNILTSNISELIGKMKVN